MRYRYTDFRTDTESGASSVEKISTFDIAYSLRQYIVERFRGCVHFIDRSFDNRFIMFDPFALAFMIKSVIKEITLSRVCSIRFATVNNEFRICFKGYDDAPPGRNAILRLRAAAKKRGVSFYSDGFDFAIGVPTLDKKITSVYERHILRFYFILQEAFLQDRTDARENI